MSYADVVEFRCPELAPFLPDDCQVNPEVYGAELAWWLARELVARGVVTSYPEFEDWGWFLQFAGAEEAEFDLNCTNVEGSKERWQLGLRTHGRKLFGRDKPRVELARPLLDGLRRVLEESPGVSEVQWRA